MTLEEECILSYYKKLTTIGGRDHVYLVQHTETEKLYVRKDLSIYNRSIYEQIKANPVPNMPMIYECIEEKEQLIVIEEYIHGSSMEQLFQERGPFPEDLICFCMRILCDTLHYLHAQSPPIIHRDIKPSNILLTNEGMVKLIDINIAKSYKDGESQDAQCMGTVEFAAPEQYGLGQSDVRTDIYAIGVAMNYMLCGEFPAKQLYQGKIGPIIKRCTEPEPQKRFQNVEELYEELRKAEKWKK